MALEKRLVQDFWVALERRLLEDFLDPLDKRRLEDFLGGPREGASEGFP